MSVFDLWLPILLAGVATHVASTLAWMVLPHHKPEWKKLPAEDELLGLLDAHQSPAGQYMFRFCEDSAQMNSDEFKRKLQGGCKGMLVLWDTPLNMGKAIGLTVAYFLLAAFLIGYIASIAFAPGETDKLDIFALVFTAGVLCHALGPYPAAFWFRQKTAMTVVDGLVFALITAGIFTLLWPGVAS